MERLIQAIALVLSLAIAGCTVNMSGGADVGSKLDNGTIYLGWHLLSTKKKEREVYSVGPEHGRFSSMYFTTNNPVKISRIVVTFGNGKTFEAKVTGKWRADHRTRRVRLPGGARAISHIDVIGRASTKQLAKVEIYGLR